VRIVEAGGGDVGVVGGVALGLVRGHLSVGHAVGVLAGSGAYIGEVDERIVATVVDVGCARVESLKAGLA
jgi:hypothetical protein